MSTLVLKNLPEDLHQRLKAQAAEHRRSLTQEAISVRVPVPLAPPIKLKSGPVTTEWILAAIAEGRE